MVNSISDIEKELIEEFSLFDDWMDKYQYIIDMGQQMEGLKENEKNEDHIVKGCVSKVWLTAGYNGEKIEYQADSDAVITKGLIAMLMRVLSGHKPEEIVNADLSFIDEIGIRQHLSPNRSNGLSAMIKKMKLYALGYQTQETS